jgi:hypothetical protein
MKAKSILAVVIVITSLSLSAQTKSVNGDEAQSLVVAPNSTQEGAVLGDVLTTASAVPRGPQDLLQDYEAEMVAITRRFTATLAGIAEAVQRGKLTSDQGQQISTEQYEVAQMQFELLAAWRAMLEQDLARVPGPATQASTAPAQDDAIAIVARKLDYLKRSNESMTIAGE